MISTAARILRLLACAALLVTGCATYRFGNGTLYAPDVRTVYVPMFQSDSYRTTPSVDVGERLTEAVCKEIEKRTPFKVVGSDGIGSWPYLALTVGLIAIGAARLYSYGRKR